MTEKLIGMTYALHLNIKAGTIRVKQATIARECGCSDRTVRGAVAKLVEAGVFEQVRTGRTALLRLPCKENCNISTGSYVPVRPEATFQSGDGNMAKLQDDNGKYPESNLPWDYDPSMSTRAEEENKYWERRL